MNTETEKTFLLVKENKQQELFKYIKKHIDIINFDFENKIYKSIVDYLIKFNYSEILKYILEHKKINLYRNKNILKYPIKHGLTEILKILIKHDNKIINFTDSNGFNAFMYAVKYGEIDFLKIFHEEIKDLDKMKFYKNIQVENETFLHFIINNNVLKTTKIFKILQISTCEDLVNSKNESLLMTFYKNIKSDNEEKNKDLIESINEIIKKPNLTIQEIEEDKTLLHLLLEYKYYSTILYYLRKSLQEKNFFKLDIQDKKGQSIFHILLRQIILDESDKLKVLVEILKLLLTLSEKIETNFNVYDAKLKTTSFLIIKILKILLQKQRRNTTTLEDLITCGKRIILKSNLNIQDLNFTTPLHLIVKYKLYDIFKDELKNKKLNITLKDKEDKNIFDYLTSEEDFKNFFNIYFESYIYYLNKNKFVENEFNRENLKLIKENNKDKCKERLFEKIKNKDFEDLNTIKYKLDVKKVNVKNNDFSFIYFGSSIDILYVCKMLKKNDKVYFPHDKNIGNKSVFPIIQYYKKNSLVIDNEAIIENNFIFWFPKNTSLFINPYLINKIIKKSKKGLIVYVPLLIYLEDKEINHMNMLYFVNDQIFHYDPYGTYHNEKLKMGLFGDLLSNFLNNKFNYANPEKYSNKIELQFFEEENKNVFYVNDSVNYCIIWCLFFSSIYFDNPNLNFEQIIKYMKINIFKDHLNLKKLIKDKLREFMEYRNSELKNQGIDLSDYYNDNLNVDYYYQIINSLNEK